MKVTQTDIARESGVDRTTVSKILSGYQLEQFSTTIVKRVQSTAKELGYKSRKLKTTLDICLVLPDYTINMHRYSFAERTLQTIIGIGEAISGTSNRLHIVNYSGDYREAVAKGDAFIIWEYTWAEKLLSAIRKAKKEFIIINRAPRDFDGSYVIHDQSKSYGKAIDLLLQAGHRKLAFVSEATTPNQKRPLDLQYFIDHLNTHNIAFSPNQHIGFKDDDNEAIKRAARTIKEQGFTALVSSSDIKAYHLADELAKLGLSVPNDISITGNHHIKSPFRLPFTITSFITPWEQIGNRAAELLISRTRQRSNKNLKSVVHEIIEQEPSYGESIKTRGQS